MDTAVVIVTRFKRGNSIVIACVVIVHILCRTLSEPGHTLLLIAIYPILTIFIGLWREEDLVLIKFESGAAKPVLRRVSLRVDDLQPVELG